MKKPKVESVLVRLELTHTRHEFNFDETACRGLEALFQDARGVKAVRAWTLSHLGEDARDANYNGE